MFDNDQIETFLLVLVRSLAFFAIGPLFTDRRIPAVIPLLAALGTAVALFPVVPPHRMVLEPTLLGMAILVGKEILLGAALGLVASFVFAGVRMAGSLLGIQMGFSIANVFDPNTGTESSVISEMQGSFAVLLFLLVDGHHVILRALAASLDRIPPGGGMEPAALAAAVLPLGATLFSATIQIGVPVLGALFLTDAALGFVARAVPQMNVFIVGIPIKIATGMLLLVVTAPLFARLLGVEFLRMEGRLLAILGGM